MIKEYLSDLLSQFKDSRVKKNIERLANKILLNGDLRVYSMSEDKKEYDVFKGLLNGSQVNTLSAESILGVIRSQAQEQLGKESRVYILHDGSDIRKPNANEMEYLGKVLSLSKEVISGYKTMNSVAVDMAGKKITMVDHETYSTGLPNYVSQETLGMVHQNSPKLPSLPPFLWDSIEKGSYINNSTVYFQALLNSHNTIKRGNIDTKITHIQDREFDGEGYFEYTTDLGDEFITRLKLSRLSNQMLPVYTPTGKLSKKVTYVKLIDKAFEHQFTYDIERISIKNKTYTNAKSDIEWEKLIINNRTYSVVRITLKDAKGKPIFQHPMMLITNRVIESAQDAKQVYQAYLLRFKIEVIFRFLKTNLGWETFQVRDFQSIKNLIALAFFLVGYFKELDKDIQNHEIYQLIAQIGGGKGIVSIHFLLIGFEKLVHFQQIQQLIDNKSLTKEEIQAAINNFGAT
jgi:hypothetical protein